MIIIFVKLWEKKILFEAGDKIQVKNDAKAKTFQNPSLQTFAGISISQIPTLPFTYVGIDDEDFFNREKKGF